MRAHCQSTALLIWKCEHTCASAEEMSREVVALRFGVLLVVGAVFIGTVAADDGGVGLCWCPLSADGVRRPLGALLTAVLLVRLLSTATVEEGRVVTGGVRTGEVLSSACCTNYANMLQIFNIHDHKTFERVKTSDCICNILRKKVHNNITIVVTSSAAVSGDPLPLPEAPAAALAPGTKLRQGCGAVNSCLGVCPNS